MEQQYILAAALLRRAVYLRSAFAAALLAKLFGLGVVRSHTGMFLFERDSLRGVTWAVRALQLLLDDMSVADVDAAAAQLSMTSQILALLCTLVCAPEAFRSICDDESPSSISMTTLLFFPRACELWQTRSRQQDMTQELPAEPVWSTLQTVLSQLNNALPQLPLDDLGEMAGNDTVGLHIRIDLQFLTAFLTMRMAFVEKTPARVDETYNEWTRYLVDNKALSDALDLGRFMHVASEGQQWAAPDTERSLRARLCEPEFSALKTRISRVFPFAYESNKSAPAPSRTILSGLDGLLGVPSIPRRQRMPSTSSLSKQRPKPSHRPGLLERTQPSAAPIMTSADMATSQKTERYTGKTTSKLRKMPGWQSGIRHLSADHAHSLRRQSVEQEPSYLSEMHAELPGRSRRASSIVSVTPSLMFPTKNPAESYSVMAEASTGLTSMEPAKANTLTAGSGGSTSRHLRDRLRRQSSVASLRA